MRLNNKGFAITGILYFVLIMFLMIISSLLLVLKTRINRLTDLNDTINGGIYIDYPVRYFNEYVLNEGDTFNLIFSNGYEINNIKYYTDKDVIDDNIYLLGDEKNRYIKIISRNNEDLWKKANLDIDSTVRIEIVNK